MTADCLSTRQRRARSRARLYSRHVNAYVPVVRDLRVHFWLPLRHGEVLLRDLVHCEIVDLAIVVTVTNRLEEIRSESHMIANDEGWPLLDGLATYRVCRTARVGDLYLTAETASRRHVRSCARTRQRGQLPLFSATQCFEASTRFQEVNSVICAKWWPKVGEISAQGRWT